MRVTVPLTITPAMLTSSSVSEPASSEPAWNGSTAYVIGDVVTLASTHHAYSRLIAGTTATSPDVDTTNWFDTGFDNRWRMFDLLRNTQTTDASPITVVITPGQRIRTIGLVGLVAETVEVIVKVGASVKYNSTVDLSTRDTLTWSDYFFGAFTFRDSVLLDDLPPFSGATITIVATNSSGPVSIGGVVLGNSVFLGLTQYDAESDAVNFSTVTRDTDGNATLIPRRSIPQTNQTVRCPNTNVKKVSDIRDQLNAVPALWSGLDDDTSPLFDALLILGIYMQFTISMDQVDTSLITLQLQEV